MRKILLIIGILFSLQLSIKSQNHWIQRAPLPYTITEHAGIMLNDKIYVIGGIEDGGISSTKLYMYDPVQNSWTQLAPLPQSRHHFGIAAVNGKIYVLAGYTSNPFTAVDDVFEYDPQNDQWTTKAPVPTKRGGCTAAVLNNLIYLIGGAGDNLQNVIAVNEVFNPAANTWDVQRMSMPTPRDHLASAVLDSLIYVIGGRNFGIQIGMYDIVEAYSPSSNKWYGLPGINAARGGFSAETYNGKIYIFGGEWFSGPSSGVIDEVEAYDPAAIRWDVVSTMPVPRHGLGTAVTGDTIYTIGGGVQAGFSYSNNNEGFIPNLLIGIKQISTVASEFKLHQNYPNPFNPTTNINYELRMTSEVHLAVFDVTGKEIAVLFNQKQNAGQYEIEWNASDHPSGIYFYSLFVNGIRIDSKKMVLVK